MSAWFILENLLNGIVDVNDVNIFLLEIEMKNNFVAKHMNDWNKSVVMKNRKKELKKGNEKHKINYKKENLGSP